jgi:hypothetical protein
MGSRTGTLSLVNNCYYNAGWKAAATGGSACQYQTGDIYYWYGAASASADSAITLNQNMVLDGSGNLTATGNVTAYSDRRLKTNIVPIKNALARVMKLQGVTFTKIRDGSRGMGFIAQDVEPIVPEVVLETETKDPVPDGSGGGEAYLTLAYGNMVALLVEGMKEQQAQIEDLKKMVQQLLSAKL